MGKLTDAVLREAPVSEIEELLEKDKCSANECFFRENIRISVLYHAIKTNQENTIRLLLRHNADINDGYFIPGRAAVYKTEISFTLDPVTGEDTVPCESTELVSDSTPDIAQTCKQLVFKPECRKFLAIFLQENAITPQEALNEYILLNDQSGIKFLLENRQLKAEDISVKILDRVLCSKMICIFSLLLNLGININLQDNDGHTCLHLQLHSEIDLSIIKMLLDAGSNPNIKNNWGQTALHIAVYHSASSQVIRALISAGANPRIEDNAGKSVFKYAEELKQRFKHAPQIGGQDTYNAIQAIRGRSCCLLL